MDLSEKLRPGLRLLGPDGDDYGGIDGYDDQTVYLAGQRIPHSAIERIDGDHLYLKAFSAPPSDQPEAELLKATSMDDSITERLPVMQVTDTARRGQDVLDADDLLEGGSGEIRLPLIEERLKVDIRQVDLGEIDVHKTVEVVEETWFEPVTHEEAQVERVRVNRTVDAPEQPREEGDWLIIPVMEEVIVVQKQLVVVEEIRIRKHHVTEQQEVRGTVRRERASVEDRRTPAVSTSLGASPSAEEDASRDDIPEQTPTVER
jgi:uncharacterized protein (TIGR02271 family)